MNFLIFDTETTGLPDFKAPSDAAHQPHLVQLGMMLTDAAGTEKACVDLLIKPDGWTIPDDVAAIHGITTATADEFGIPEETAVTLFSRLSKQADVFVGHNTSFDLRIMRIAMLRHGYTRAMVETVEAKRTECTMRSTIKLLNLPPTERMRAAGFNGPKQPKLGECIKHFFGHDLDGAHNAMVDVRACARVFFHLQTLRAAA